MAEAVIELVLSSLRSPIQKKLANFLGFDEDFKSLSSLLTTIKATLDDAEEKQFTERAVKDWLHKLKDAAFVLHDILDECATQARGTKDSMLDHHIRYKALFYPLLIPRTLLSGTKLLRK
jgi:hypothetical protein